MSLKYDQKGYLMSRVSYDLCDPCGKEWNIHIYPFVNTVCPLFSKVVPSENVGWIVHVSGQNEEYYSGQVSVDSNGDLIVSNFKVGGKLDTSWFKDVLVKSEDDCIKDGFVVYD